MTNRCEFYEDLLLRLPDRDLSDEDADALQEHLRTCAECRNLFRAMKAVNSSLSRGQEDPPETFTDNVMSRILSDRMTSNAQDFAARRSQATKKRRWRRIAVAACLVLVIGGASAAAAKLLNAGKNAAISAAPVEESVTLDLGAARESTPASDADNGTEIPAPAPAEGAVAQEAAAEEAVLDAAAMAVLGSPTEPAQVPAGREAEFEAILTDSGEEASMTTAAWNVIAYVEYRGVIYEFLADDAGQSLLWRDAAEGVFPIVSPKSPSDLTALFQ